MQWFSENWLYVLGILVAAAVAWRWMKKNSFFSGSSVSSLGEDLLLKAKSGKMDPVIGRDAETERMVRILSRRTKNNPVLIGPPGVGKTALVENLAIKIASGDVPEILRNKKLFSLSAGNLLSGTKYRGEMEERIKHIMDEVQKSGGSIILFIDELHTLTQSRGAEGSISVSDMMKPALARGELQIIGATSIKEYNEYILSDETWARRFQPVMVAEPTVQETVRILKGLKSKYEDFHKVVFTEQAISEAVRLSREYIKDRLLPDKAIDVIDEAAAMVKTRYEDVDDPAVLLLGEAAKKAKGKEQKKEIQDLRARLEKMLEERDAKKDPLEKEELAKEILLFEQRLQDIEHQLREEDSHPPIVDASHVKEVVSGWSGVPLEEIH